MDLARTLIAGSKFHDSGIGTYIAPTTLYAETTMSYNHEGSSVRGPPLPEEAKKSLRLYYLRLLSPDNEQLSLEVSKSSVVHRQLLRKGNNIYQVDIYLDLQTYTCIDSKCAYSDTTFARCEHWVSRLASDHEMEPDWTSIKCFLCREDTGSGKIAITLHLAKHLEEISLSATPCWRGSR